MDSSFIKISAATAATTSSAFEVFGGHPITSSDGKVLQKK